MREIKFRYRVRNPITYKIEVFYWPLIQIERDDITKRWFILSRDLYIGKKDKHGVEIYEGDIIQDGEVNDPNNDADGGFIIKCPLGAIVYDDFEYKVHQISTGILKNALGYHCDIGMNIAVALYDINLQSKKVIGNIYENPELLEEK